MFFHPVVKSNATVAFTPVLVVRVVFVLAVIEFWKKEKPKMLEVSRKDIAHQQRTFTPIRFLGLVGNTNMAQPEPTYNKCACVIIDCVGLMTE